MSGAKTHPRGHMKGTAVRTGVLWYAQRYGTDTLGRAMEHAPQVASVLRLDEPSFGIVASGWYDTRTIGKLLVALEETAGIEDGERTTARSPRRSRRTT